MTEKLAFIESYDEAHNRSGISGGEKNMAVSTP
jgi:hypothetical protein